MRLTDMMRAELLDILKTRSFQRGHFVLASGKTSEWYLDCRITALSARGAFLAGALLYQRLQGDHPDAVGGMVLGAAPLVTAVSVASVLHGQALDGFLVRKETKAHGAGKQIEGHLAPWMRVAMVEDVATTGGSTLKAIQLLKQQAPGITVCRVVALVDREAGAKEAFNRAQIPFEALYSVREFLAE
jgi:orotate phosphoribosyltransferase